jgi:MoaA/NifB/PqqE/SkfB family radical SAM enzyme
MKYTQFDGSNPFGSQAKMLKHWDRVSTYLETGDTHPIFMEMNLTSKCNMKCKWCISENFRRTHTLDTEHVVKFMDEFYAFGGKAVTFSGGGEPTQHPDFEYLLYQAAPLNLGLMTNGAYNVKYNYAISSNCDWVRISLDTVNREKYKAWKGVDEVDLVLRNIETLRRTKVGVNCNVGPEHTLFDLVELVERVEDYASYIQFRPILPRYFKNESLQVSEVFEHLKELNHPLINISNDKLEDLETASLFPFKSCEGHFFSPILNSNGDVCVCMYHPEDPNFVFGNIYRQSFSDIWNSPKRGEVIQSLRQLDYCSNCQVCCKLTELNKFIDFVKNANPIDVNFL